MFIQKTLSLTALSLASLFFTACTSTTTPLPVQPAPVIVHTNVEVPVQKPTHQDESVDLSQKGPLFHSGMNDGCATAKGKYSKDSALYNGDASYKEGWFYGRRKCQTHRV